MPTRHGTTPGSNRVCTPGHTNGVARERASSRCYETYTFRVLEESEAQQAADPNLISHEPEEPPPPPPPPPPPSVINTEAERPNVERVVFSPEVLAQRERIKAAATATRSLRASPLHQTP